MTGTNIKKLYVAADDTATFICPKCGAVGKESVQKYKNHKVSMRVECSCSHSYEVQLEFRKFYRKETNLDGLYIRSSNVGDWGKMVVKNLSMGGCGFKTMGACTLVPGEEIKIEFVLDGHRGSTVKKKAIVLEIEGRYVGCKFSEQPSSYDADLGFYLKIT